VVVCQAECSSASMVCQEVEEEWVESIPMKYSRCLWEHKWEVETVAASKVSWDREAEVDLIHSEEWVDFLEVQAEVVEEEEVPSRSISAECEGTNINIA